MTIQNHISKLVFTIFFFLVLSTVTVAQELYTAQGYWKETTKETYQKLKNKQTVGNALTADEVAYLQDYETYLANYYNRLSDAEKIRYEQMKDQWDRDLAAPKQASASEEEFEWRGRDRFINIFYGAWYGTSLVLIADIDGAAAGGIPLVTGGLWALGPVVNPKKYEGITRATLRAGNTGKFLGLIYGASLGLMVTGDSDNTGEVAMGISTLGSIALGEVGFQMQKRNNYSEGHIEMIRHYGVLGPWLGISLFGSTGSENVNLVGASLLAGGVGGLIVGNKVSRGYAYTKGDVQNITSLTWISTGLGFALMAESLDDGGSDALILIPAAASVLGTVLGQKSVKGVNLTKRQGSTIGYSAGGAALLGLGIVAITESESVSVWVGVPSALALVTQQILFNKYKRDNLASGLQSRSHRDHAFKFSMNVMPENYFINQQMPVRENPNRLGMPVSNPLVKMKLTF